MNSELLTAKQLEEIGVMKKGTAYRMAKAGLPHYKVGTAKSGIRFRVDEVLSALRVPVRGAANETAIK